MQSTDFRVLSALLLVTACGAETPPTEPEAPPEASGWTLLTSAPMSPAAARHDDVFFLDARRGWLINTRGEVHGTDDGGDTWRLLDTQAGRLNRAVGFATPMRGWLGNLNGFSNPTPSNALFETLDGGSTWSNITMRVGGVQPVGICGIDVVDDQTIYAVGRWNGPAVFIRSRDGGDTWEGFDLAPLATGMIDVHFFDRDTGLIVGGLGVGSSIDAQNSSRTVILGTTDGGDTWETRYVSTTRGKWAWKISFPSRTTGYVATQGAELDGVVLKTTDGGLTWTEIVAAPDHGFSGIGFVSERQGWVASDTVVFQTDDAGGTWRPVVFGDAVNRFRILSPDLAFAAGDGVYRWRR